MLETTAFGPVSQLAWVTADLDATERALAPVFGVAEWTRMPGIEFGPEDCTYRGEPADFAADVSLAYAGDLQLEIIRPVRGRSLYTEHLAEQTGGLHHVCCEVPDMDAALAKASELSLEVVQHGTMAGGLMRFAYLDLSRHGAGLLELAELSPDIRAVFEDIKARSRGSA